MNQTRFIFLDIETTGLDPTMHSMIELAAVATDADFNQIGSPYNRLISAPAVVWDPWCIEQHSKSGLVEELRVQGIPSALAAREFREWLVWVAGAAKSKPELAGASVQFDMSFLGPVNFGGIKEVISHRYFDVSTLRTLAKLVGVDELLKVGKGASNTAHRALDDIAQDITHAKIFRGAFEEYGDLLKARVAGDLL